MFKIHTVMSLSYCLKARSTDWFIVDTIVHSMELFVTDNLSSRQFSHGTIPDNSVLIKAIKDLYSVLLSDKNTNMYSLYNNLIKVSDICTKNI